MATHSCAAFLLNCRSEGTNERAAQHLAIQMSLEKKNPFHEHVVTDNLKGQYNRFFTLIFFMMGSGCERFSNLVRIQEAAS